MKTIWKYPIRMTTERIPLEVPAKAFPLKLANDYTSQLCLWMAVDDEHEKVPAEITIVGTGERLPADAGAYLDTIFVSSFVFHFFYKEVE